MTSHVTLPWKWVECDTPSTCPQIAHLDVEANVLNELPRSWVEVMMGNTCYLHESHFLNTIAYSTGKASFSSAVIVQEEMTDTEIATMAVEHALAFLKENPENYTAEDIDYIKGLQYENLHFEKILAVVNDEKQKHNTNGPAVERADRTLEWYSKGKLHREDGPAVIHTNGTVEWYCNGELHREDGPAVENIDGTKQWYINDKLHHEDEPAVTYADGSENWYRHGKLHREDGPAVIDSDGTRKWHQNDELHREDGPAIEYADGRQAWYLNGQQCITPQTPDGYVLEQYAIRQKVEKQTGKTFKDAYALQLDEALKQRNLI